jgi:methyl-accepting chemotaxis protein
VVADEMRALSDRTATSTKEIAGVINTIQEEIASVKVSIKEGMEMVNASEAFVYKVGESMGAILEAAQKSSVMAETIDHATGEQANSLDLVTQAMSSIKTRADKMSSVMIEQQKGSEHMLERVGEVKEVAEITKRSTEEQASGTAMMSKNVELASTKISGINAAIFEQQSVHDTIVTASEDIKMLGGTTLKHMEEMKVSLSKLADEIVALRSKMSSFKVE